jgi:hypothetical protein
VMSFKSLLRIDEDLLEYEDQRAFDFCEEKWNSAGRPTKKWKLVSFIESLLKEFIASGLQYPRVLLLRKKEIQRGTFAIDERVTASVQTRATAHACNLCSGGWILGVSGAKPCSCPAGEPHRAMLAKWGWKEAREGRL